ncbi:TPA: hypothetical protein HA318_01765 [Candidatus Micrarchaeota archaeon]|nr:MAG: hypothetical protein AUJ65_06385 [Candidatus Micrarchaeota archaeon CG1_02_51_15]HII38710.1 hypothetical protein [Candidatus Micrarchaeota archaeon]
MNVISKTLDPYFLYGMALDVIGVLLVVYVVVGGTEELLSNPIFLVGLAAMVVGALIEAYSVMLKQKGSTLLCAGCEESLE